MSNLTKSIPADERKMLKKAFWRSFTLYAAVSPAKQGASGFCYALMPFINKFYKNDEEGKKEALVRSMSYFNTTITCSTFIMGLVASMEKKNSEQKDFDAKAENMTDAEKEKLFADMQQQFNQKRTSIEKEMADQVTGAVKSVASKRGLSLVVDKAAVIYGGTDITKDVSDSLAKSTSVSADAAKTDAAKTDSSTTK